MERRLATILVADAVGSTAAMAADEEGALARIGAALDAVAEAAGRFGGRVFATAGDGLLVEFPSPVNALRAAMEGRGAAAALPGGTLEDMRFGLHLADVAVTASGDLRGDGVNLAARLQGEAAPGEIAVSGALYDHVLRVSPCRFEDLGARALKGMPEPVRIYRVREDMTTHRFNRMGVRLPGALGGDARASRPHSIAVAPFRVASSADEDQLFLAEGLADDLTLELSRIRRLFVAAPTAAAAIEARDPVAAGRALGVRYLLSGSARRMGTRLRLNLSLVETGEGRVIWSDRIQRPFDEVFEVIDDVAGRVAGTVTGRIDEAEIAAATLKRPDSLTAYERHLRGLSHHRLGGVSDAHFREAKGWFERAMRDDPDFARARAMRVCSWSNLPDYDWDEGRREARAALELDPGDAEANRIVGSIALKDRDYDAARPLHARAVALAPSDAFTVGRCAAFHTFVGETEAAHELLDRAEALDPFLPVFVADERIAALYVEGRHEEVCAAARALPFQTRRSLLYRAAARMARGEPELARRNIARALSLDPTLSLAHVRFVETHSDDARMESLTERLAAAGLPERPPEAAA